MKFFTKNAPPEEKQDGLLVSFRVGKPDFTQSANLLFSTFNPEEHFRFLEISKTLINLARNVSDEEPIIKALQQILDILPYQRVSWLVDKWVSDEMVYVPSDLVSKFKDTGDGINTARKTYVYEDYVNLIKMGIWIQAINPCLVALSQEWKLATGAEYCDTKTIDVLHLAWGVRDLDAYSRLNDYINEIRNTEKTVVLTNVVSTDQIQRKLVDGEMIKRVSTNNYISVEKSLVAELYKGILNQKEFTGAKFSHVHDKKVGNGDPDDSNNAVENVRVTSTIVTLDVRATSVYITGTSFLEYLGLKVTKQLLKDISTLKQENGHLMTMAVHPGITDIIKMVISDVINIDVKYIDKATHVHLCVALYLHFKLRGLEDLALVMLANPTTDKLFSTGSSVEICEDKVAELYPYTYKGESVFFTWLDELTTSLSTKTWEFNGKEYNLFNVRREIIQYKGVLK